MAWATGHPKQSRQASRPCRGVASAEEASPPPLYSKGMRPNGRDKNGVDVRTLSDAAMAQLYRGELSRSDKWRTRLDTTTNWALTTTAAVISFGFANTGSPHVTFIVGIWMVITFLLIEARR